MKPEPTGTPDAIQTSDTVQNSALGAHRPLAEHVASGRKVPVSAATPDDQPQATREAPPVATGHDIGRQIENSSTTPAVPVYLREGVWYNSHTHEVATEDEVKLATNSQMPKLPHVTPGVPPLTPKSVTQTGHLGGSNVPADSKS